MNLILKISKKNFLKLLTEIEKETNQTQLKSLLEKKEILEEEVSFLESMK